MLKRQQIEWYVAYLYIYNWQGYEENQIPR